MVYSHSILYTKNKCGFVCAMTNSNQVYIWHFQSNCVLWKMWSTVYTFRHVATELSVQYYFTERQHTGNAWVPCAPRKYYQYYYWSHWCGFKDRQQQQQQKTVQTWQDCFSQTHKNIIQLINANPICKHLLASFGNVLANDIVQVDTQPLHQNLYPIGAMFSCPGGVLHAGPSSSSTRVVLFFSGTPGK